MLFSAAVPDAANVGWTPGTALVAFSKERPDGSVTSSVTLSVAAASRTSDRVREMMWNANISEHSRWEVDIVAKSAINVTSAADTAAATNISHSTFTTRRGSTSATFDYWAFTSTGQRYLLSYARRPTVKTPDAATFFATATSCPKSTPSR